MLYLCGLAILFILMSQIVITGLQLCVKVKGSALPI